VAKEGTNAVQGATIKITIPIAIILASECIAISFGDVPALGSPFFFFRFFKMDGRRNPRPLLAIKAHSSLYVVIAVMRAVVLLHVTKTASAFVLPQRPGSLAGSQRGKTSGPGVCFLRCCTSAQHPAAEGSNMPLMMPVCVYTEHLVKTSKHGPPAQDITVEDLTPAIKELVASCGVRQGTVTVVSRHTTTAVTINEWESRLVDDIRTWLLRLAPPDDRSALPTPVGGISYFHNDIDKRPDSDDERQRCRDNGWDINDMDGPRGLAAWRKQEPINAHSHLLSMILGSSESIPVHNGKLVLGQWQSVMLVDLDGPRDRTVGIQVMGFK